MIEKRLTCVRSTRANHPKKSTFLVPVARLRIVWQTLVVLILLSTSFSWAQTSGNPVLPGYQADPEMSYFNGKYYIYTTTVNGKQFHAYSSLNMTNWQDEGVIFDIGPQCTWAEVNGWAPAVVFRNNKYYFYYTAEIKIGVAVGNSPIGPFTDLGQPLIGSDPFTVDIIDPAVFIDDDGQAYIYYGGSNGSQMGVRRLNADMVSTSGSPMNLTPPTPFRVILVNFKVWDIQGNKFKLSALMKPNGNAVITDVSRAIFGSNYRVLNSIGQGRAWRLLLTT